MEANNGGISSGEVFGNHWVVNHTARRFFRSTAKPRNYKYNIERRFKP